MKRTEKHQKAWWKRLSFTRYPRWYLIFQADYYATTARFREIRKQLPLWLFGSIIAFTFLLRYLFELLFQSEDISKLQQVDMRVFTIIGVFTYFLIFAPLLSPLGKVFFDTSALKYQEVLASTPVHEREIVIGNFLSNLVFFLPMYGFLGTLSLSFIAGNLWKPWWQVALLTLAVLSFIIILGLTVGTVLTPLFFTLLAKQKADVARAIVTLGLSGLMMGAIYLTHSYSQCESIDNLGMIQWLPFSLAANLLIYALYGVSVAPGIKISVLILVLLFLGVTAIGLFFAEELYNLDQIVFTQTKEVSPRRWEKLILSSIGKADWGLAESILVHLKLAFREIENLSRFALGMSITIFLLYSLTTPSIVGPLGTERLLNATLFFAYLFGAASMAYTEIANFSVQHREIFVIYKSIPNGVRNFLLGKWIQMSIVQVGLAGLVGVMVYFLHILPLDSLGTMTGFLVTSVIALNAVIVGIYAINPTDNEEDINNILNMLVYFALVLALSVYISASLLFQRISLVHAFLVTIGIETVVAVIALLLGITALQNMNVETLDSLFSRKIKRIVLVTTITFISWGIMPLFTLMLLPLVRYWQAAAIIYGLLILLVPLATVSWKDLLGTIESWKTVVKVGSIAAILMGLTNVSLSLLLSRIYGEITYRDKTALLLIQFARKYGLISVALVVIGLAIIEELFFRGYVLAKFKEFQAPSLACVVSAVLFGLLHWISWIHFTIAVIMGIILAWSRLKSQTILLPLVLHGGYNFLLILLNY